MGNPLVLVEPLESLCEHWRVAGSGLDVDPRVTAPAEVRERCFAPDDGTPEGVPVEVLCRHPIGEFPGPLESRHKAAFLWIGCLNR
ncbi:hypothetical protein D3C84_1080300 [compost metagenome]